MNLSRRDFGKQLVSLAGLGFLLPKLDGGEDKVRVFRMTDCDIYGRLEEVRWADLRPGDKAYFFNPGPPDGPYWEKATVGPRGPGRTQDGVDFVHVEDLHVVCRGVTLNTYGDT